MVDILIFRGSRKKQVTAVTLAIQKFCAIVAYDDDAAGTTWTGRGRARTSPVNKRIYDEAPVSNLQTCKIGDWVQNTITGTMDQAVDLFSEEQFHHLHYDGH